MKMFNYMNVVGVISLSLSLPLFAQIDQVAAQPQEPVVVPADATPQPAPTDGALQPASTDGALQPASTNKPKEKIFDILARGLAPRGIAEVNNPDVGSFQPVLPNKAYPLGSTFRTGPNSSVVVNFSLTDGIQLMANTEVVVFADPKKEDARTVKLVRGQLRTFMKDNMPEDMFSVSTPNALCKNLVGRAEFLLGVKDDFEELTVATITGQMAMEGLQFNIPTLRAANTVNVLTATNRSLSRLISEKGDFKVILSTGTEFPVNFDISPRAVIKIWREVAPVGGRTIVSTLVVGPSGTARNRFVYAVGRDDLSTGELVDAAVLEQQEKTLRTLGGALSGQPPDAKNQQGAKEDEKPVEQKKPEK
jgi:FecR protein